MFLQLDLSTSRIPTDADVECDFGDGLTLSEKLDALEFDNTTVPVQWMITHSYTFNGKYNVSCRYIEYLFSIFLQTFFF